MPRKHNVCLFGCTKSREYSTFSPEIMKSMAGRWSRPIHLGMNFIWIKSLDTRYLYMKIREHQHKYRNTFGKCGKIRTRTAKSKKILKNLEKIYEILGIVWRIDQKTEKNGKS